MNCRFSHFYNSRTEPNLRYALITFLCSRQTFLWIEIMRTCWERVCNDKLSESSFTAIFGNDVYSLLYISRMYPTPCITHAYIWEKKSDEHKERPDKNKRMSWSIERYHYRHRLTGLNRDSCVEQRKKKKKNLPPWQLSGWKVISRLATAFRAISRLKSL